MSQTLQLVAFEHFTVNDVLVLRPQSGQSHIANPDSDLLEIRESLMEVERPKVVFDLNDIDLFGSDFIGILVSIGRIIDEVDGDLVLCNVNEYTRSVFSCLHLFELNAFYNCLEDAIVQFQPVVSQTA